MSNSKLVFVAIICLVIGGLGGYLVSNKSSVKLPSYNTGNPTSKTSTNNSVFSSQIATVQGKITKVNNRTITVQNTQNNQIADFQAADRINVIKLNKNNSQASPSASLDSIETNKNAFIDLQLVNDSYQVTAITYTNLTFQAPSSSISPNSGYK